MRDRHDIANRYEPLSVDQFANENNFAAALHEVYITGVEQDNDGQEDDNSDSNSNTDEYPDDPPGITLDPAEARGEIVGVP